MWRFNPSNNYYNRGYKPRRFHNNSNGYNSGSYISNGPSLDLTKQENRDDDDKQLYDNIESKFIGDMNRRNFTPTYPTSMASSGYQAMNNYGRNTFNLSYSNGLFPTTTASTGGYVYLNDGLDASTVSSSFPLPSQGYDNTGYYDPYAAQYSNPYVNLPYVNQTALSAPPLVAVGPPQVGYETYDGYYAEGQMGGVGEELEGYAAFVFEGMEGGDAGNEIFHQSPTGDEDRGKASIVG